MEKTELLEKINSFPYWLYPFSLRDGVVIHPTNKENAREKIELRDFIWPVVMAVNGGSLKGFAWRSNSPASLPCRCPPPLPHARSTAASRIWPLKTSTMLP